ncbi:MAG: exosortase [Sedimentisphaerales bacterium]
MLASNDIKAIILAGKHDFGRCPIASRLPAALWPVMGKPSLERIIVGLAEQGIRDITVCCNGDSVLLQKSIDVPQSTGNIKFLDEPLPMGTAGSIRDAANGEKNDLLVVFSANMVCLPDISLLIAAHRDQAADLTVVFNPASSDNDEKGDVANIYICNPAVPEYIPAEGYHDIKESLIPEMVRAGKRVRYTALPHCAGNFRDGQGYLRAVTNYLAKEPPLNDEIPSLHRKGPCLWMEDGTEVDPSVRFFGPVVVMAGARVAKGAVVFGPSIIGRKCGIGRDSVVMNSVLWDTAGVDENCEVRNCLLDYGANIASDTVVQNKNIPFEKPSIIVRWTRRVLKYSEKVVRDLRAWPCGYLASPGPISVPKAVWLAGTIVVAAFIWSYWPGIVDLWSVLQRSDEYSSGILVPFLAGYVLWSRREQFKSIPIRPSLWGGLALLFACILRLFGMFFLYVSAERFSLVVSIAAILLLLFGWVFFKKTATTLLFLCLMLPWPNRVQALVALPLQQWATSSAAFCLEIMGYDVIKEGNIIHIGQTSVAVAEACNGLRMVTAFFVISALVVMLVRRKWWEKLVVMASSLPIALLCNTIRLTVTAMAFTVLKGDYWEKMFHDFGGYAMMPLALAAVIGEFWLLGHLTVMPNEKNAVIITRG